MLMPLIVELNPKQLATFEHIGEELRARLRSRVDGPTQRSDSGAPAGIASADAEKLLCEDTSMASRENNQADSQSNSCNRKSPLDCCHAAIR